MHEYVQKSTSTTLPRSPFIVSGLPSGVLSHFVTCVKFGASPQVTSAGDADGHDTSDPETPLELEPPFKAFSCFRILVDPSTFRCRTLVYPGTSFCKKSNALVAMPMAIRSRTTPPTCR